jgi:hypothetical protein
MQTVFVSGCICIRTLTLTLFIPIFAVAILALVKHCSSSFSWDIDASRSYCTHAYAFPGTGRAFVQGRASVDANQSVRAAVPLERRFPNRVFDRVFMLALLCGVWWVCRPAEEHPARQAYLHTTALA